MQSTGHACRGDLVPPAEAVRFHLSEATNLFDEEFKFFEVDFDNPTIQPTRTVFARVTLAFP